MKTKEFAFDVVMSGALRVRARDEAEARRMICAALDCASANLGAWPDGSPILAEVSTSAADIAPPYEIDGEPVEHMTPEQIETAARHFIIAAIWADCPEGTRPRATAAAHAWARGFVERFAAAYPAEVAAALNCDGYGSHPDAGSPEAALGHDLYLTAAGHGVGFSDRDELGDIGRELGDQMRNDWRRWHVETQFYRGWLYLDGSGVTQANASASALAAAH